MTRMMNLMGLYQKGSSDSVASGISYGTQPTDIPMGGMYSEKYKGFDNVYEFVQISGTCTVGDCLYLTGTTLNYVTKSGTNAGRPYGFSLVAPTASGAWTFIQKQGINTSLQITGTVADGGATSLIYGGVGSALGNVSNYLSGIASGNVIAGIIPVGRSLTNATGSQTIGYIDVL